MLLLTGNEIESYNNKKLCLICKQKFYDVDENNSRNDKNDSSSDKDSNDSNNNSNNKDFDLNESHEDGDKIDDNNNSNDKEFVKNFLKSLMWVVMKLMTTTIKNLIL